MITRSGRTDGHRAQGPARDSTAMPRRFRYGSAGVLALLLLAAVAMVLLSNRTVDGRSAEPPPGMPPQVSPSESAESSSGDQPIASPPPGISWQSWHAIALPYGPPGPRALRGQVASGFQHSQAGALLASVHSVGRLTAALDPGWAEVIDTMAAPGPGRDAWKRARAAASPISATPLPGSFAQVAGFLIVSYDDHDAVIQLVTRNSDSSLSLTTIHMTWLNDWKIVLTPNGGSSATRQSVDRLTGFVPWGAVS